MLSLWICRINILSAAFFSCLAVHCCCKHIGTIGQIPTTTKRHNHSTQPLQSLMTTSPAVFRAIPFAMGEVSDRKMFGSQARPPPGWLRTLRVGTSITRKALQEIISELCWDYTQHNRLPVTGERRQRVFAVGLIILLSELQIEFRQNLNLIKQQFVLWQILSH